MQDVLLLVSVAVMFSFGWFVMGRLDDFLESNRRGQNRNSRGGVRNGDGREECRWKYRDKTRISF